MSGQLSLVGEGDAADVASAVGSAAGGRHRLHRFPGRGNAVKVLYGDDELAVVRCAASEAGLRVSSYVAAAALAAAGGSAAPSGGRQDRQALAELVQVRAALRQYGNNLNQIAAALNSGAGVPGWLLAAVEGGERAVRRVDEAAQLLTRRLT